MLAEVLPAGDNAYGGFACLRPFLEDLQQRAKVQRALEHLTKAQSLAPRQAHTYYQIGRAYCLLGNYERAVPAFQTFTELRPKNPLASLELGFALLNACPPNGKCADGLNSYDVWRTAGVTAEHFLEMAERERQKENYPEALLYYQQAQRMGRELRSTIAYVRYLLFKANGDEEKAFQALQSAVEMDRGWVRENDRLSAWLRFGVAKYDQLEFSTAMKIFNKALELNYYEPSVKDEISHIYRFLGLISYHQNNYLLAKEYFLKSLSVDPTNIWSHVHYGWILYFIDAADYDTTLQEFETALALAGNQIIVWNDVIKHLIKWGKLDQASLYCQRAEAAGILAEVTNCELLKNSNSN